MSDEILSEVVELVYGPGSELISKMNPTQSDLHGAAASTHAAKKDRKQRAVTAGLSAVGAGAGAAGLAFGGHKIGQAYRKARTTATRGKALKAAVGHEKLGAALIPLEVAGLGGELMATKILHGDTKKKGNLVKKDLGDLLNNSSEVPSKRSLTRAMLKSSNRKKAIEYTKKGHGQLKKLPNPVMTTNEVEKALLGNPPKWMQYGNPAPPPQRIRLDKKKLKQAADAKKVQKNDDEIDVVWDAEISKADADKQQIFGWASVVEVNGEPIVDLQGDQISVDEMERAGYEYVMKSRKGGDMHLRNNWEPIQKSEMIESFIVTPEKREAMGLPDSVPSGWWVGFKVQDPSVWSMVKSGERTGFSIHGHGRRSDA